MNFVEKEKVIQDLLKTSGGKNYSGNYIYTRDEQDTTYKIGMSQASLFKRLRQAKSCYPFKHEFWLRYIIISLDGHYTKGSRSTTITIEKALHTASKHLSTVTIQKEEEQGNRPREYRIFSNSTELPKLLKSTLNTHRKAWDYIIVFNRNGWHLIPNNRIVKTPIKSIEILKPKSTHKQPEIASMPLTQTKMALPKNLKVGDVVPQSKNWSKFKVKEIISKTHLVAKFPGYKQDYDIYF